MTKQTCVRKKQERTCIACYKKNSKVSFLRLVRQEGEVLLDLDQSKDGRGAYVCKDQKCVKRISVVKKGKKGALGHHLKVEMRGALREKILLLF